jgi:hypothetical protein
MIKACHEKIFNFFLKKRFSFPREGRGRHGTSVAKSENADRKRAVCFSLSLETLWNAPKRKAERIPQI